MTGDMSHISIAYHRIPSSSYDPIESPVAETKSTSIFKTLSQKAQNTAKSIKSFIETNFSKEKWGKINQAFSDSLTQTKEKLNDLKARVSPRIQQLSQKAQKAAKSLGALSRLIFNKENFSYLSNQAKEKINSLSEKVSPDYEKLKHGIQETKDFIYNLLFYKSGIADSEKKQFRLFFTGAIQTLNTTLHDKIFKLNFQESKNVSSANKIKAVAKSLGQKLLFNVASRLLILVATPFQIIRDIALMPVNIKRALQVAHLEKKITLIRASRQSDTKNLAFKTAAKIYSIVSLKALKNIGLVLFSPLKAILIGSILLLTGVEGLTKKGDNLSKTLLKNVSNLTTPKGITKKNSENSEIELERLKKGRSLKNAAIGQNRKRAE